MKSTAFKSALLALALLSPAARANESACQALSTVVSEFSESIRNADKPRFLRLFINEGVAWQSVYGRETLQRRREHTPGAGKFEPEAGNSHIRFIDNIVGDAEREEETFHNIRIETDGDIATVFFDFHFLSDGRESNRGREAWALVSTDAGWRIVSVIYTINRPPYAESKLFGDTTAPTQCIQR